MTPDGNPTGALLEYARTKPAPSECRGISQSR